MKPIPVLMSECILGASSQITICSIAAASRIGSHFALVAPEVKYFT